MITTSLVLSSVYLSFTTLSSSSDFLRASDSLGAERELELIDGFSSNILKVNRLTSFCDTDLDIQLLGDILNLGKDCDSGCGDKLRDSLWRELPPRSLWIEGDRGEEDNTDGFLAAVSGSSTIEGFPGVED